MERTREVQVQFQSGLDRTAEKSGRALAEVEEVSEPDALVGLYILTEKKHPVNGKILHRPYTGVTQKDLEIVFLNKLVLSNYPCIRAKN